MARITVSNASEQDFIPLMDELARAHQLFSLYDAEIHRLSGSDLTAPQAKVIFCLGNTGGMTCSDITDKTLITKGTLTGVIDRLEEKGLVQRWGDSDDGRRIIVDLTKEGVKVFKREYPKYLTQLKARFDGLGNRDRDQATALLSKIAALF
ncbi:MAG: MarR family transcriptional regulator [Xanthomonadales bacterium]|nr:MarR family transcriptional regulator [Xanthomonadales bacterium]